ncbi:MAG: hypothetical protein D3924_10680 [Candidatus Electrothrix sp. AR4]|nr:hypothetical protein [Candidatus Electrothrix sp. AR4]
MLPVANLNKVINGCVVLQMIMDIFLIFHGCFFYAQTAGCGKQCVSDQFGSSFNYIALCPILFI